MVSDGKVYLEGRSKNGEEWETLEAYQAEFDHPLWKRANATAKNSGHGGSDYLTLAAFVDSVRTKTQPPIDVYDIATWRAITPLTEQSFAGRSRTVDLPDFTRGNGTIGSPSLFPKARRG